MQELSDFRLLSWNVSGIANEKQSTFVDEMQLYTGFSIACIQEFGNQEEAKVFQTGTSHVYISPGISKASRSNCICILEHLNKYVVFHHYVFAGQVLGIRFGRQIMCLLNLHFPYNGHSIRYEETLEALDSLLVYVKFAVKKTRNSMGSGFMVVWGRP